MMFIETLMIVASIIALCAGIAVARNRALLANRMWVPANLIFVCYAVYINDIQMVILFILYFLFAVYGVFHMTHKGGRFFEPKSL